MKTGSQNASYELVTKFFSSYKSRNGRVENNSGKIVYEKKVYWEKLEGIIEKVIWWNKTHGLWNPTRTKVDE